MEPERVWSEFCAKLASGTLAREDCRPLAGDMLHQFLSADPRARELGATLAERPPPPSERCGDKLILTVPMDDDDELRVDFLLADDRRYLFQLESITIPVQEITSLPCSDFPALPRWETWMREEIAISERIGLFVRLAEEKGRDEALE